MSVSRPKNLVSLFQFHEGPIKTSLRCFKSRYCSCFNSMKVRLKQKVEALTRNLSPFQFHEGPIKTFDFECREHGLIMFQFHEGPIKTKEGGRSQEGMQVSIP